MSGPIAHKHPNETSVLVRYWAGARAAVGLAEEELAVEGPITLRDVLARVQRLHPGPEVARVLAVCSVLVGDRPARSVAPEDTPVSPGEVVEFLPPFAGG